MTLNVILLAESLKPSEKLIRRIMTHDQGEVVRIHSNVSTSNHDYIKWLWIDHLPPSSYVHFPTIWRLSQWLQFFWAQNELLGTEVNFTNQQETSLQGDPAYLHVRGLAWGRKAAKLEPYILFLKLQLEWSNCCWGLQPASVSAFRNSKANVCR